jgi:hypothetical protein
MMYRYDYRHGIDEGLGSIATRSESSTRCS